MRVDAFDFDLPEELIALRPAVPRDSARLLMVSRSGAVSHHHARDLPQLLAPSDTLVLNDTKVIHARLRALRPPRGPNHPPARVEIMLHTRLDGSGFLAFARPARKLAAGDTLDFGGGLTGEVAGCRERGEVEVRFSRAGATLDAAIAALGEVPLPPYIAGKRAADARDAEDYQTVFAREEGSVAAPTAGLHFTPALFAGLAQAGIGAAHLTLHVGAGTFLPVTAEDTGGHRMHAERAVLTQETAQRLNAARAAGRRIICVGTTALRTLETAADASGVLHPYDGKTDIFITPGYRFRVADGLLTNFHLPRSTLFMLVSAFCGLEVMRGAYAEAVAQGYRFYSYGDACLLWRGA